MFSFFNSIVEQTISLVAGAFMAVGLMGAPAEPADAPQNNGKNETQAVATTTATSTEEKIQDNEELSKSEAEQLKQEIEDLKRSLAQQQRAQVAQQNTQEETTSTTEEQPEQEEPEKKTYETPSGAVLDEDGNVIKLPDTSSTPDTESTDNETDKKLTATEIFDRVSPSIVLIETSDGHGTGFVVENGKYTITNAHVVGSNEKVTLTFKNGVSISAPVLGRDKEKDIALIYNNNRNPESLSFGSSQSPDLNTGANVYAFGYPLEYKEKVTFTRGVVSTLRRERFGNEYIQTDASIHPGNSGGPLINEKGKAIGINTAGKPSFNIAGGEIERIGGTGIGFAIPIETVKRLVPELSQYGESRYEQYPIGSTQTIKRSFVVKIGFNEHISCEKLAKLREGSAAKCDLYRNHHDDYKWKIIEDTDY